MRGQLSRACGNWLLHTSGQYEALEIHGQSFRIGTERKIVLLFIELSTFTDE